MGIIRFLLALSVVAAHFGGIFNLQLVGGQIAVQSFFIISGFYMSFILNEKYVGKYNSYRLFISNRFLRLYPVYWTVLLLTVFLVILNSINEGSRLSLFPGLSASHSNVFTLIFLVLTNIFIFCQDLVMFLGININTGHLFFTSNFMNTTPGLYSFLFIPQAWTLGLELMFYLIAPFILRKGLKFVTILILISVLVRFFVYDYLGLKNDPWTYRFFPNEISFFLLGYVSYRIYLITKNIIIDRRVYLIIYIGVILFTILFPFLPSLKFDVMPFSIKEIIYFIVITLSIPLLFSFFKKSKFDNQIGELSYPIYISHMLVGLICLQSQIGFIKQSWVIALIVVAFSWLLNYLVAKPIEKYRQSRLATVNDKSRPVL